MSSNSIRFHLRERTAEMHARLDSSIGGFETREAYRRYLPGMLAFREAAEDAVMNAEYPTWFGDWRPCRIAPALRADLRDLGMDAPEAPYRRHDLGHALENAAALLGTLYVLEGSALGARLLFGRAKELGLDEKFGARHLALQTQDRESWRNFVNIMERAGQELDKQELDRDEAGKASLLAFALAERRLTKELSKDLAKKA